MSTTTLSPKKESVPALLKVNDVARLLAVSRQSVRNLIESGDLNASVVSAKVAARKHKRVTRTSLLCFYKKRFGHSLTDALANPYQP